jgi:chromosome segregation ATPase
MSSREGLAGNRRADRIFKIISELQQETEQFEAEFEVLLKQSSENEKGRAEATERLEHQIKEAEEAARRKVQQELLARFEDEIGRLNVGFEQRLRQEIAETEAAAQARLDQAASKVEELKTKYESQISDLTRALADANVQQSPAETTAPESKSAGHPEVADAVRAEISRIQIAIQEITQKLDDAKTELSTAMRLNRELSELSAYLKGLRYSIGEPIV